MSTRTTTKAKKKEAGNPVVGCGCLILIVFIIIGAVRACSGGDEPAPINSLAPAGTAAPTTAPATSRFTPTTTRPAPTTTATTTRPAPAPDPDPDPDRDRDRRAPAPAPTAARKKDDDNDSGGGSVYYKNCAAVRAAGKAPIRSGDPGYRPGLDSDGDGQGCAQD